jgi:hypothetical protein
VWPLLAGSPSAPPAAAEVADEAVASNGRGAAA